MGFYLLLIEETEKTFFVYFISRIIDFFISFRYEYIFIERGSKLFIESTAPLAPNTTP